MTISMQVVVNEMKIWGAVDDSVYKWFDCRRVGGKYARHFAVNDIILRTRNAAGVPSHLKPVDLSQDHGKRPHGATLIPWKQGRCFVWDFTCPNNIARSKFVQSEVLLSEPNVCLRLDHSWVPRALGTRWRMICVRAG